MPDVCDGLKGKKKSRCIKQYLKTQRTEIRQTNKTKRKDAKFDSLEVAYENGLMPQAAVWDGISNTVGAVASGVTGTAGALAGKGGKAAESRNSSIAFLGLGLGALFLLFGKK